ncbi:VirB4-like conjugal transfer ATPase, CD1110 family [Candidatus Vampirococcus lugosii]|uniref:Type IV secretory pathway, VirB4 component n=1 Tax=Candidatus Vampirococcus lugosii TaxID=2789015 RepID=A0ABS5QKM2_9BACT|nr:DUF87 domain-containing protein [Candidatus Vampirococcus lugosii]MBS8121569.1 Type IV secretory pathway, VirB4 component [Candidatus Vampirococcus lugosii]
MSLNNCKDVVYDSNYTGYIQRGGGIKIDIEKIQNISKQGKKSGDTKKVGFFDSIFNMMFGTGGTNSKNKKGKNSKEIDGKSPVENKSLQDQLRYLINLPDEKYKDSLLTSKLREHINKIEKEYIENFSDYKSHIAASYWELKSGNFNISGVMGRTYYAIGYPSYLDMLWTRDTLSFHSKWDMTWFIYPSDDASMQGMLKRRATQLKAEISESMNKGITLDSEIELEYKDVESIRQKLATREERYFQASYYTTIYADNEEKLNEESKKFEQKIGGNGIKVKPCIRRMDEGYKSINPLCLDELGISRSMLTSSIAGSFPFISSDLVDNKGILYGINLHTGGLIIFDRFSPKLANANSTVLATSGAGKSFTVKLEILRYLILGIDVIVIDPENEYKTLINSVGGTYINIAVNSSENINPFDLPPKIEDVEYGKGDLLRSQVMNLIGLIGVLVGGLSVEEEAILDTALQSTYSIKDITFDDETPEGKTVPLLEDLLHILEGMEGGATLGLKISKYVTGTFSKLFNNPTNVDLDTGLTVFSIRDLDESLKTPAMFNVLNFIWTKVRSNKKKRLLIIDEAWIMMQHDMSANFLFGLIKRARKYGLGVTTISQDVEDFVRSPYGKPIVANSAVNLLLKQSTSSIKALNTVFGLSEAEKQKLVSSNIGEGLFFAGNQHVAMKILASPYEKEFIETNVK